MALGPRDALAAKPATPDLLTGVAAAADAEDLKRQLETVREDNIALQLRMEQLEDQLTEADAALSIVREQLLNSGRIDLSTLPSLASPKVHVELEAYDSLPTAEKVIRLQAERYHYEFRLAHTVFESKTAASQFALAAESAAAKIGEEVRRTVRDGLLQYGKQVIKQSDFAPPAPPDAPPDLRRVGFGGRT